MKHIFSLKLKNNTLDRVAFKKEYLNKCSKLGKLQFKPHNDEAEIDNIYSLFTLWIDANFAAERATDINKQYNKFLSSTEKILVPLLAANKNINRFKREQVALGTDSKAQTEISKYINILTSRKNFLIKEIKSNNKSEIKKKAIMEVFSVGEKYRLKSNTKQCAGRTHINELYEFVTIMTGISSRTTLGKYYKMYQESKL